MALMPKVVSPLSKNKERKEEKEIYHTCFVVTIYNLELANFNASGTPG